VDNFRSSCAAQATGSSFGCLVPCWVSHRMSCSGPVNCRPSSACTAKSFGVVISAGTMVGSAGECIRLTHRPSGFVMECEVEAGQVKGPLGLPPVQLLGRHEVLQVLMVRPDLALIFRALNEVPPLLEGSDDRQHLLVVDLIVLLDGGQGLGEEGNRVPLFFFRRYLEEDRTCRKVGTVGFDAEGFGRVGRDEDRRGSDTSLQPSECGALGLSPVPAGIVSGQVEERAGVLQEVSDKPSVEVGESEDRLHFLFIRRSGPLGDASDLDRVHHDGVVRDYHSEILDRGFLELALVGMEVELVLLQQLQNAAVDLPMLFKGFCEDEDVVQVDHDHAFRDEVLEDVVHHRLEGGGTVREPEEHDKGLVQAAVGLEGRLPLVSFLYPDVVKPPPDVQLREVLGSAELCNQLRD